MVREDLYTYLDTLPSTPSQLEGEGFNFFYFLYTAQFSRSVVSDSLGSHESQHARLPCPSPSPGVHSNSCPSSRWCHPGISSSVVSFSSCPQPLPASESFPMSQLFAWGGQSPGVSALASFLPKNTQGWSPLEWTGWISFLYTKSLLFECNKLHWLTVFRWSDIIIILWEKTNKQTNHELVTWTSCQYVKWEIKKITEFCLLKKFCYFFNC